MSDDSPEKKYIEVTHEDFSFMFPDGIEEMSDEEMRELHHERVKAAPGHREGKPPETWYLHDNVTFEEEVETFVGKQWGAQGLGKLREVLVSPPTTNEVRPEFYEDPISYWIPNRKLPPDEPNLDRWMEQYQNYVDVLEDEGVTVHELEPPEPALGPYGFMKTWTSTADAALVINGGAIIPRESLHPTLRGRNLIWNKALVELGIPILRTIHGNGIAELGGGVWIDDEHYVANEGSVMNREGLEQVKEVFDRQGIKLLNPRVPGHLDNVTWPAGGTSHPAMWVQFPDYKVATVYPPMVEYNFIKFLKKYDFEILEATPEDYQASGVNMVNLEPGKVVMPTGADELRRKMESHGIEVITVPINEPARGEGGAGGATHCTLGQLRRDRGPLIEDLQENPVEEVAPEIVL